MLLPRDTRNGDDVSQRLRQLAARTGRSKVYALVFALRCASRKVREPSQDDVLARAWLTRCASAFRVNRGSGAPAGAVRSIRQQT